MITGDFTGFIEDADSNDIKVQSLTYSSKDGKLKIKNIGETDLTELRSGGEWLSFDAKNCRSQFLREMI